MLHAIIIDNTETIDVNLLFVACSVSIMLMHWFASFEARVSIVLTVEGVSFETNVSE